MNNRIFLRTFQVGWIKVPMLPTLAPLSVSLGYNFSIWHSEMVIWYVSYFSLVSGSACCDSSLHGGCTLLSWGRGLVRLGWRHGGGLAQRKLGEEWGGDWGRGFWRSVSNYLQSWLQRCGRVQASGDVMGARHTAGFVHNISTELKGPQRSLIKSCWSNSNWTEELSQHRLGSVEADWWS